MHVATCPSERRIIADVAAKQSLWGELRKRIGSLTAAEAVFLHALLDDKPGVIPSGGET
jgi:hypothetical protein